MKYIEYLKWRISLLKFNNVILSPEKTIKQNDKKTKNSIPFSFNPKGWFPKGKEKERAKAQHELSGVELDKKLADIDDKPFVTVLNTTLILIIPKKGYFELTEP